MPTVAGLGGEFGAIDGYTRPSGAGNAPVSEAAGPLGGEFGGNDGHGGDLIDAVAVKAVSRILAGNEGLARRLVRRQNDENNMDVDYSNSNGNTNYNINGQDVPKDMQKFQPKTIRDACGKYLNPGRELEEQRKMEDDGPDHDYHDDDSGDDSDDDNSDDDDGHDDDDDDDSDGHGGEK